MYFFFFEPLMLSHLNRWTPNIGWWWLWIRIESNRKIEQLFSIQPNKNKKRTTNKNDNDVIIIVAIIIKDDHLLKRWWLNDTHTGKESRIEWRWWLLYNNENVYSNHHCYHDQICGLRCYLYSLLYQTFDTFISILPIIIIKLWSKLLTNSL